MGRRTGRNAAVADIAPPTHENAIDRAEPLYRHSPSEGGSKSEREDYLVTQMTGVFAKDMK